MMATEETQLDISDAQHTPDASAAAPAPTSEAAAASTPTSEAAAAAAVAARAIAAKKAAKKAGLQPTERPESARSEKRIDPLDLKIDNRGAQMAKNKQEWAKAAAAKKTEYAAQKSARTAREEQMEREKNHRMNRTAAGEREAYDKKARAERLQASKDMAWKRKEKERQNTEGKGRTSTT